jgi:hypothetical protein
MLSNVASIQKFFDRKYYTLSRNTSAIQAVTEMDGNSRLGTILQLPEGAEVRVCGEGFNERTIKVCWEGGFYYIFTEDLGQDLESKDEDSRNTNDVAWAYASAGSR